MRDEGYLRWDMYDTLFTSVHSTPLPFDYYINCVLDRDISYRVIQRDVSQTRPIGFPFPKRN
jgi:hypothetical protein